MSEHTKDKVMITPPPKVESCPVCHIIPSKYNMNLNNEEDVKLADIMVQENTNEFEATTAVWNECCGSFKGYLMELIKTHEGKSYAKIE